MKFAGVSKPILLLAASGMALGSAAIAVAQPVALPAPATTKPAVPSTAPASPKPSTSADQLAPLPEGGVPVVAEPEPAPLPPLAWTLYDAQELLTFIRNIAREGLTPADYDPDRLAAAIAGNDMVATSALASELFNRVSADLAFGHVRGDDRQDWHVSDADLDPARQRLLLETALKEHRISQALNGLLPTHPQYGALRHALEVTPAGETAKINRIRLNMDRWRWLPRDLGRKYIIVNVPSFHATLVEDGKTRWKNRAIAGAIKTPTPQLTAMATGVILNPWWEVPQSISREVAGKAGYVAVKGKDGKVQRWRQPPGPSNALGQLKFVMPNDYAIYLHDTNARSRFNSEVRALSHGCIRTQHVVDLATELLGDDDGEWTKDRIDTALKDKKTVQASFVKPVPVYIVYFSSAALNDGRIIDYADVYKRDGKVIAALLDRDSGRQVAAKDKVAAR